MVELISIEFERIISLRNSSLENKSYPIDQRVFLINGLMVDVECLVGSMCIGRVARTNNDKFTVNDYVKFPKDDITGATLNSKRRMQ